MSPKFLVGILLILIALALWITRPYLGPIVLGLLGGFLLNPVHRRLMRYTRWPTISATILMLGVAGFLVAPFVLVVWQFYDDAVQLIAFLQDPARVHAWIDGVASFFGVTPSTVTQTLIDFGRRAANEVAGQIVPALRLIMEFFIALIVFFFVLFFAIRDGHKWIHGLRHYIPLGEEERDQLFQGARSSIRAIVLGTFGVAAIQGVVAAIGWWLLGFPNPVFWGTVMVIVGIFPFGAPFLITVPASIIAIASGDIFAGVALLVFTVTVVGLTDDLLRPFIVGRAAAVHPALVLVGMLGGIAVFGVAGFLLGPLIFALLLPVLEVWAKRRRDRGEALGRTEPPQKSAA